MTEEKKEAPSAEPREPEITPEQFVRALMGMLASTRTAVVLLGVIAAATVLGTILPNPIALKYVYGRVWFHALLGFLGLNLAACMVWRKRIGLARIWSLLTHLGILLVLVGALVTLVSSERGYLQLAPGMKTDKFFPGGEEHRHSQKRDALGFTLRLKDFRLAFHPPVDRFYAAAEGQEADGVKLSRDGEVEIAGPGIRVARATFTPDSAEEAGFVEFTAPGGERRSVPAEVGTVQDLDTLSELDAGKLSLSIMRYEPGFIRSKSADGKSVEVGSRGVMPDNPALLVAVVRGGKAERPQWLFAKIPGYGRMHRGRKKDGDEPGREPHDLDLRFMHPTCPRLEADLIGPSGTRRITIDNDTWVLSPWGGDIKLGYKREPLRISEYESEVEVLEKEACDDSTGEHKHGEERVVKHHVIRVNSPLVHNGTKLSQNSCYWMQRPITVLGVSRDVGVWFVYAGFLAGVVGVMGRFYLVPALRKLRAGRRSEGE
ncbi:MAG: cytochrome c biogenesis protein ResB [Planctomycetota bacterium]|jgi:hypothetical protein